ncbi:hypothetical protein CQ050_26890 [Achromobacter sp. MYb9]|uniref:hypothetical protein n=1 Tax=Achromobacter sp. MYb9 TaxID=1827284 RepID=UPI000CFD2BEF|nr:hypothetical protein [Achromobacter sp. MYb9]PQZ59998.1 hypothetical protein CQ050_26890 [Achromobacter sp. MYb9]
MKKLVASLETHAAELASLASYATCILSTVLAAYTVIKGDAALGGIAFAIIALVFKLEVGLLALKSDRRAGEHHT